VARKKSGKASAPDAGVLSAQTVPTAGHNPSDGQNPVIAFARKNQWAILLFSISLAVNLTVLFDYQSSPYSQVPAWDGEVYW
jgi:hypothetical protein